jgi:hypothetical protein
VRHLFAEIPDPMGLGVSLAEDAIEDARERRKLLIDS